MRRFNRMKSLKAAGLVTVALRIKAEQDAAQSVAGLQQAEERHRAETRRFDESVERYSMLMRHDRFDPLIAGAWSNQILIDKARCAASAAERDRARSISDRSAQNLRMANAREKAVERSDEEIRRKVARLKEEALLNILADKISWKSIQR